MPQIVRHDDAAGGYARKLGVPKARARYTLASTIRRRGAGRVDTNFLPYTDLERLEPGCCCPAFDPTQWDKLDLHFRDKLFVHVRTRSLFHIPLDMSAVFFATWEAIQAAGAEDCRYAVLSNDESKWHGEHYFAVTKEVPGLHNVTLSGNFTTRVFEGPYRDAYIWVNEMREDIALMGHRMGRLFFYYTTCPKCAERRGKNYVVGVGEVI